MISKWEPVFARPNLQLQVVWLIGDSRSAGFMTVPFINRYCRLKCRRGHGQANFHLQATRNSIPSLDRTAVKSYNSVGNGKAKTAAS